MKKHFNIAALVMAVFSIVALSALIINVGLELAAENEARAEDYQIAQETEVAEIQEEPEPELQIQTPAIHPAGHGFITWYYTVQGEPIDYEEVTTSGFEISPESEVVFTKDQPTDEGVYSRLVGAIKSKHEQDARAIHFMEGYMNDDLTEGTMQYASSEQIRGEVRFTVEADGEIIANASDWEALPETDERTVQDFQTTAESMLVNWGAYNR
ncbi:hypothetical protein SAMN04488102_1078 [Alkalibacterium subtropicum]|uniref:Uncharacterized protein n=2 Tax=Alkalibacterium subtropicum TaxID=753702 RepID=A0A1I1JDX8_9LACT|nr:hypothetical protein SAMN04488102_1078 [Alkalibacterium subtropicum]